MEKDKDFTIIHQRILRYLAIRPRSQKEIENYLQRKLRLRSELKTKILDQLINEGLVDDENFALWWLDQRAAFRPKGRLALSDELRQKGIEKSLIEKVLSQNLEEIGLAKTALSKKMKAYNRLPSEQFHRKAIAFLQRRGFSWETVKSVVDEFSQKR